MAARTFGSTILCLAILGAVARAEEGTDAPYAPPDFMTALPPLPAGVDARAVWKLELAEALSVAVHQNLGVVLERESLRIAGLGIDVARGQFEPLLTASGDHGSSQTPPTTSQEGGAGQILTFVTDDWRLGLAQRLSTGMRLEIDFISGRARSSAGTAVEPINYRSTVSVSVSQPLLRGFSRDLVVPRLDVLRAELASERERQQLTVTVAELVERTEDAYWDVVQALYRYDLELRSQRRAEEQMELTKRQIAAGLMPPSDLISAESTLAQRRLQLLSAEQTIEQTWDALRGVLHLPHDQWTRPILPVDVPRFAPQTSSADDALAVALAHRPELALSDLDLKTQLLAVRQAENNKLPQLDLGLTGALIGQDARYPGALGELGRADASAYTVTLNLTWTPLQRATTAAAEIERARERMAHVRREQAVQDIWLAVRDAVRTQRSAARQVIAAAKFRELSTQSLEVEQRKFLSGTSSNFVVAQRQEELANAQLAELTAVLGHKKATAALLRATGQLLDERHIELAVRPK